MMRKIYICAPLGGDVEENLRKVKRYTQYALKCGTAPVVPHFYALCLNKSVKSVWRQACLYFGSVMNCGFSVMRLVKV